MWSLDDSETLEVNLIEMQTTNQQDIDRMISKF